jgi:hypothetical protein
MNSCPLQTSVLHLLELVLPLSSQLRRVQDLDTQGIQGLKQTEGLGGRHQFPAHPAARTPRKSGSRSWPRGSPALPKPRSPMASRRVSSSISFPAPSIALSEGCFREAGRRLRLQAVHHHRHRLDLLPIGRPAPAVALVGTALLDASLAINREPAGLLENFSVRAGRRAF